MSLRVLAPICLLIAAAASFAAVFAVQRIENGGGPLSEPYASRYVSPNGDGIQDDVTVRFTTKDSERITISFVDRDAGMVGRIGPFTATGETEKTWDVTGIDSGPVHDGTLDVIIEREGDRRAYSPTFPVVVDRIKPRAALDRYSYQDGALQGLVALEPAARLVFELEDGSKLGNVRLWKPGEGTVSGTPTKAPPAGTQVLRFRAPIDADQLARLGDVYAVDRAGNRTPFELHLVVVT